MFSTYKKRKSHTCKCFVSDSWLPLLTYASGLSNVTNLIELSLEHGFLTVLTISLIIMIVFTIPLTYMELVIGQYNSGGPYNSWDMCRLCTGVAWAMLIVLLWNMAVYLSEMSHVLWFLCKGIQLEVDWTNNTFEYDYNNRTLHHELDILYRDNVFNLDWQFSGVGDLNYAFLIANCVTCTLIFIFLYANSMILKQMLIPFFSYCNIIIISLLLFSFSSRGFSYGFTNIFIFKASKFCAASTWKSIVELNIFSLGLGLGGLITISSKNKFRDNIHIKSICLVLTDLFISISYVVLFYNMQGIIAFEENISADELMNAKNNILFVRFPMSLVYFVGPIQFWNFILYSCIYIQAFPSIAFMFITVQQFMIDFFPILKTYQNWMLMILCSVMYLGTFILTTQLGVNLLIHLQPLIKGTSVLFVLTLELFGVLCLYGTKNLVTDTYFMMGINPYIFRLSWYISPIILIIIFIYSIVCLAYIQFPSNFEWLFAFQFIMFSMPILFLIVSTGLYLFYHSDKRIITIFMPNNSWGPQSNFLKNSRKMFDPVKMTNEVKYRQQLC